MRFVDPMITDTRTMQVSTWLSTSSVELHDIAIYACVLSCLELTNVQTNHVM